MGQLQFLRWLSPIQWTQSKTATFSALNFSALPSIRFLNLLVFETGGICCITRFTICFNQIQLNSFDPGSSSTASLVSCSDKICTTGFQTSDSSCSSQNQCIYQFQYGDGSGTSGNYVKDLLHLDRSVGESVDTNSSASIVFG